MKKNYLTILSVILLILVVSGSTYAIYTWAIKAADISGDMQCFEINYTKGQDIGNNGEILYMSEDYRGGLYANVIIGLKSNCSIDKGIGTLYLTTDETVSNTLLQSGALKYQVIENNLTLLNSGTITSTGTIPIVENISLDYNLKNYSVSIWLDGSLVTNENKDQILSSNYKGKITMKAESR